MADKQPVVVGGPTAPTETVRVLRVLEYVGKRSWVESTLRQGLGPNKVFVTPNGEIRMAVVGDWPQPTAEAYSEGIKELICTVERVKEQLEAVVEMGVPTRELLQDVVNLLADGLDKLTYYGNVNDRIGNPHRERRS